MKCPYCDVEMIHGYLNCGMILCKRKVKWCIQKRMIQST